MPDKIGEAVYRDIEEQVNQPKQGASSGRGGVPNIAGVVETALFVVDTGRSEQFYRDVFGFRTIFSAERIVALVVRQGQILLLFKKGAAVEPIETPGGIIPASDSDGQTHLAFSISEADLEAWEQHLVANGVEIESRVRWDLIPADEQLPRRGGRSLYFRDPDDHLLELLTPGVWPGAY